MRPYLLALALVTTGCPAPPDSRDDDEGPGLVEADTDAETSTILDSSDDSDSGVIAPDEVDGAGCDPATCPDDGNPCTDAACGPAGACVHVPNLRPCDDGSDCLVDDRCTAGVCAGRPLDCDDRNDCTDDACVEGRGCVSSPRAGACDDGDACTTDDACADGACAGAPRVCPAPPGSHGCAVATCDPRAGCGVRVTTGACDDDDLCTTGEACDAGRCVGALVACDDGDPCTDDWCDPTQGCTTAANQAACDDGDPCTRGDRCDGGACRAGPEPGCCGEDADCEDGDPCTADRCDDGACHRAPTCGDADPCTLDLCTQGACSADPSPVVPAGGLVLADFEGELGPAWTLVSDHPDVVWQRDDTWSADGLWSLYIGKVPDYSYDFGATRAVASWRVGLPTDAAELGLEVRSEVAESSCSYDALVVRVDDEALSPGICGPTSGTRRWDVRRWAGSWVVIDLEFDTVDDNDNDGAGIWIDRLHVTPVGEPECCAPGSACP
ncbi:MAG: hypothetical protein IT385_08075 [Deltaproteobacteria bacterium]|nr:hypothetical protein [Deltaproteobacteria bacterium]